MKKKDNNTLTHCWSPPKKENQKSNKACRNAGLFKGCRKPVMPFSPLSSQNQRIANILATFCFFAYNNEHIIQICLPKTHKLNMKTTRGFFYTSTSILTAFFTPSLCWQNKKSPEDLPRLKKSVSVAGKVPLEKKEQANDNVVG
jgi:hypothetical protein